MQYTYTRKGVDVDRLGHGLYPSLTVGWPPYRGLPPIIIMIIINLLAQKHDKVTRATKQIERDSISDTDVINSCPRKVQIKLVRNTLQQEVKVI